MLSSYHHGFRAYHSTEWAILQFASSVYNLLNEKYYVVLFIGFSKEFDSLDHNILFKKKLENIGIRGLPLQLFKSYISNGTQTVYCNSKYSDAKFASTGVPQGSVLGPYMFLIYINDIIYSSTKFKFTIHANDTNLLIIDKNISHLLFILNLINWNLTFPRQIICFFQNRSVEN